MKIIISIFVFFAMFFGMQGQSQYYDAIALAKLDKGILPDGRIVFKEKDTNALAAILTKYAKAKYYKQVELAFSNNPFIKVPENKSLSENNNPDISKYNVASLISTAGGLDVTNLADGLAKFLVKRTKQELTVSFFGKFKTELEKKENKDLKVLFPQTNKMLMVIGEEMYNYEAYIQTLRAGFEKDLSTISEHLPEIIENHQSFFAKHKDLPAILYSGTYISNELANGVHPGNILNDYPVNYLDSLNKNWKASIQTLQLISSSLRSHGNDSNAYWINRPQINTLLTDQTIFKIYLGLIYQTAVIEPVYDSIHFENNKTFTGMLKEAASTNLNPYKSYILNFSEKANKVSSMIKNKKKPANDSLAAEQYYTYVNATLDLIKYATAVSKLKELQLPDPEEKFKDYFDVIQSTANIGIDINRRNYASVIIEAAHIYDFLIAKYSISISGKEAKDAEKELVKKIDAATLQLIKENSLDKVNLDKAVKTPSIQKMRVSFIPNISRITTQRLKTLPVQNTSCNCFLNLGLLWLPLHKPKALMMLQIQSKLSRFLRAVRG